MHVLPAIFLSAIFASAPQPTPPSPPGPPSPPTPPVAPAAVPPLKDLNVSPFQAVEWDDTGARGPSVSRVKIAGEWFELVEVNGWNIKELLAFSREQYGPKAVQRFEEDLPQLLIDAQRPPASRVTLRVRMPIDGRDLNLDVEMTKENRRGLRDARRARERAEEDTRPAAAPVDEAQLAAAALREFRELLVSRHAYSLATPDGPRLVAMVDDALNRIEKPTLALAALTIRRVIGASRDGHARVSTAENVGPGALERFTPFLLVTLADEPGAGIVAIKPDRSGLLDPAHPFVIKLNGVEIEERLKQASEFVADGSPALVRERSCRELRSLGVIAVNEARLLLSASPTDDSDTAELIVPGANSPPRYSEWPRRESGPLEQGSIGYIRLADMSDDPRDLERMQRLLGRFRSATGLIIDVRGNGGGSRDALMLLASECMDPAAAPIVFNAARPLTLGDPPNRVDGRMASRFLRRADATEWTDAERAAIARFAAGFQPHAPDINFDAPEAFGPWYYGVLSPAPGERPAGRRVIVLMDNVCFSATDIFLAAMKEIDNVTLVGRPSAGGSGMALSYPLAGGAITVNLSSMVSFQPDGTLFDGVGVKPDVLVTPAPTDFVLNGTDTTLDAAVRLLAPAR